MRYILYILLFLPLAVNAQFIMITGGGPGTQGEDTIYYVDATLGNDADDGLTTITAWQTVAKVVTEFGLGTFDAGNVIAFKKGEVWAIDNVFEITGSSGSAGSPIIIDGGLWGTGDNATIKSNSAGGAIPKYYALIHIAACDYITIQNMIFDGDSTNRNGVTVGGNHGIYGPTQQNDERFITIQDCRIVDIGVNDYNNALICQTWNNDIYNITFQRNYINGAGASGMMSYGGRPNLGATVATTHNLLFAYDTVTNCGLAGGVGTLVSLDGQIDSAIVEHCYLTQGDSGSSAGILISPDTNIVHANIHIRYNEVRMYDDYPLDIQGRYTAEAGLLDAYIYYNLFVKDSTATGTGHNYIQGWDFEAGSKLRFYNNVFVGGYSGACLKSSSETVDLVTFNNNTFLNHGTNGLPLLLNFTYDNTIEAHSNNSFYCASGSPALYVFINGVSYHSDDMGGWEATATITDPAFVTNYTDLHIQGGSPAINAGVNIPTIPQFDFDGVAVADPPEIGAYEY